MNVKLERKSDPPSPTNITCPWDSCKSNICAYCHGIPKLIAADVDNGDVMHERLICANYERRKE